MCENVDKPVRIFDRTSGKIVNIKPIKVWILKGPRNDKGIKIAIFKSPITNKYFRARLPDDYPC